MDICVESCPRRVYLVVIKQQLARLLIQRRLGIWHDEQAFYRLTNRKNEIMPTNENNFQEEKLNYVQFWFLNHEYCLYTRVICAWAHIQLSSPSSAYWRRFHQTGLHLDERSLWESAPLVALQESSVQSTTWRESGHQHKESQLHRIYNGYWLWN